MNFDKIKKHFLICGVLGILFASLIIYHIVWTDKFPTSEYIYILEDITTLVFHAYYYEEPDGSLFRKQQEETMSPEDLARSVYMKISKRENAYDYLKIKDGKLLNSRGLPVFIQLSRLDKATVFAYTLVPTFAMARPQKYIGITYDGKDIHRWESMNPPQDVNPRANH
jgi:hypothetical protein